jgi:hypothetical protein
VVKNVDISTNVKALQTRNNTQAFSVKSTGTPDCLFEQAREDNFGLVLSVELFSVCTTGCASVESLHLPPYLKCGTGNWAQF